VLEITSDVETEDGRPYRWVVLRRSRHLVPESWAAALCRHVAAKKRGEKTPRGISGALTNFRDGLRMLGERGTPEELNAVLESARIPPETEN
jgi:hypothetical protein